MKKVAFIGESFRVKAREMQAMIRTKATLESRGKMTYQIIEMTKEDYPEAFALWERTTGMGLGDSDSRCAIGRFLDRNPGLSFVVRQEGVLVGTCLGGTDGRRGFIYHLAVDPSARRQGIGQALVSRCLAALHEMKVTKCHIMVFGDNDLGLTFWQSTGWKKRMDIALLSYDLAESDKGCSC